ncbi:MAG: hypothetical protein WAO15_23680, partial [Mycobacterium sp.]
PAGDPGGTIPQGEAPVDKAGIARPVVVGVDRGADGDAGGGAAQRGRIDVDDAGKLGPYFAGR